MAETADAAQCRIRGPYAPNGRGAVSEAGERCNRHAMLKSCERKWRYYCAGPRLFVRHDAAPPVPSGAYGAVAKRKGNGLQIRHPWFKSRRRL